MVNPIEALRQRSKRDGIRRVFTPGILAINGGFEQYNRDHASIRGVLQDYKQFNAIQIVNNSGALIAVDPDFATGKRIVVPAHTIYPQDLMNYLEFNVTNIDTATATASGEVVITCSYERPLVREGS